MRIAYRAIISLGLAVSLMACINLPENSVAISTAAVETAVVKVSTAFIETQAALVTSTPSPFPLLVSPMFTITPFAANPDGLVHPVPEERLEYAMATAPKVHNHLPYMAETGPYGGQYFGCASSNDFSNAVYYSIMHPLKTVTSAFAGYFQQERWAFTEATTERVGSEIKVAEVSYDVYRVLQNEPPALERLQIALRDESTFRGKDHIDARVVLTHIETKEFLRNVDNFSCGRNNQWLWMGLSK
jgi:hypothetical protein